MNTTQGLPRIYSDDPSIHVITGSSLTKDPRFPTGALWSGVKAVKCDVGSCAGHYDGCGDVMKMVRSVYIQIQRYQNVSHMSGPCVSRMN